MVPPGNNTPPSLLNFSNTCTATGSLVEFTINKVVAGVDLYARILEQSTGNNVWSGNFGPGINQASFTIPDPSSPIPQPALPNGVYELQVDNTEVTISQIFEVTCTPTPATCTIALTNVVAYPPTSAGGSGLIEYELSGLVLSAAGIELYDTATGQLVRVTGHAAGVWQLPSIPPATYRMIASDAHTDYQTVNHPDNCTTEVIVVVPGYVGPIVQPVIPPTEYHPVGGVLPNQASLAVPVAQLLASGGGPRVGLYVEVELTKLGAPAPFAIAKRVIRTTADTIDVSQYLRAELQTQASYAPYSGLFRDSSAGFGFTYRYRELDNLTTGNWQRVLGKHYGILAAMPPEAQNLLPYVVSHPYRKPFDAAQWPLAFASGEAAQVVGYPLEVALLLAPRAAAQTIWLEVQYFDGAGQLIELRSTEIADTLPAGYYRYCLPADPLPCAAYLELVVSDSNRAFIGSCGGPAVPATPGGNLVANGGYLKL